MILCSHAVYLTVLLYMVLNIVMLGIAIRLSDGNVWKVLIASMIFNVIMLIDLPLILPAISGVCS